MDHGKDERERERKRDRLYKQIIILIISSPWLHLDTLAFATHNSFSETI